MFKIAFKRYKRKTPPPDLQEVVDVDCCETESSCKNQSNLVKPLIFSENSINPQLQLPIGLRPQKDWRCYKLIRHPGLLIIRNPFTWSGQRYWMARCLRDYPRTPNVTNLDSNLYSAAALSDWWRELHENTSQHLAQRLKIAMRWTTLGYHHNWDTKHYDETMHTEFPSDLSSLCHYFSLALEYKDFLSQAAIVNYYPIGTTLSGHTDHSELDQTAPLFSFSFGQTAIFLIGGTTLEEEPTALFLRSGDVLVMSKESRLCYHAVPRVMKSGEEPWNNQDVDNEDLVDRDINCTDSELYNQIKEKDFWMPFDRYIDDSRININVRQVLPANVTHLKR